MTLLLRDAPGPRPVGGDLLSLFLYYKAFRRDPLAWISDRFSTWGDSYYARYGVYGTMASRDPAVITDVLITQPANFCRSSRIATFRLLKKHLGEGLLTTDGALWKHQRRLINPAFRAERIDSYGAVMVGFTEQLLERFAQGESRDIHRDMVGLTFRIAVQCLFGHDVGFEGDEISRVLGQFRGTVASPANALPDWFPHPAKRNVIRCVKEADRITHQLITDRRTGRTPRGDDLLSSLVDSLDETDPERSMPLRRLRDEMVTLLIAGHETTSNTCAWTLYLLAKHPEYQHRLQEELDGVCRGGSPQTNVLDTLPYLEWVVQEAMRIYPAVYAIGRDVAEDTSIAGYHVPAGNSVLLWTFHAQNDPRWFPQPEAFVPERFEPARLRNVPQGAYAPFGIGARACIGKRFAMQEARLILGTLLSRYEVALVDPNYEAQRHLAATMAPRGGLPLILRKRTSKWGTRSASPRERSSGPDQKENSAP